MRYNEDEGQSVAGTLPWGQKVVMMLATAETLEMAEAYADSYKISDIV